MCKIETDTTVIDYGVLLKKGEAVVQQVAMPEELNDEEVLIKQDACNICTTDYGQWLGLREHQGYPMAGGHESSGTIVQVGKDVKEFKVGDRVSFAYSYCGRCKNCKVGRTDNCTERKNIQVMEGIKGFFGFAAYAVRKTEFLVKTNKDLDPSFAAFIEPLATVVSAQSNITIELGKTVLVVGAGTMGILNALVARLSGARVIISELMENKIEKAKAYGFEVIDAGKEDVKEKLNELTDGEMADVVILGVGAKQAAKQSFELVRQLDGEILFFSAGYPAPEIPMSPNELHYRRLKLIGAFEAYMENFYTAADILSHKLIDVTPLIEKVFDLKDIQEAFEYASQPGRYRVSVKL
ncbi:zinc-dependent alcohol dehydrogenase [Candidatus Enterococcus ferrettii]|uniref:Alcohol dehydrogenase n=1 Tax=Candidatus Enterococcus ferrettii TaxID=2815324 RepID=A0ABV0EPD8_9ENTE|nr:alcohol dehydrogenase catalytic domain-containing protein [Enterococcus sp. 665A]MBO1340713.1 alcohol dehydrogenase catalytic domain-containing protein [Enterococcus sp. 665A]